MEIITVCRSHSLVPDYPVQHPSTDCRFCKDPEAAKQLSLRDCLGFKLRLYSPVFGGIGALAGAVLPSLLYLVGRGCSADKSSLLGRVTTPDLSHGQCPVLESLPQKAASFCLLPFLGVVIGGILTYTLADRASNLAFEHKYREKTT